MDLPLYRPAIEKLNAITASAAQINESATMSSAFLAGGTAYFVDSTNGVNAHDGLSWATAKLTIANAVATCAAGDTIFIKGTGFSEAVTCSKAGVRFIGVGTGPAQATWTAPTVADSFCLKLTANYCLVENIKIKPVIYVTSGVPSGIYLSGANYTFIKNNRFQGQVGSYVAIYSPVCDSDNVQILNNEFLYMNTATYGAAIQGVEAGGLSYSGWHIENNYFNSCTIDIDICGRACVLRGNVHPIGGITAAGAVNAAVTGLAIDLSGTSSGGNTVTGCSLAGAYTSTLYKGGAAGDNWAGNYAAITTTYCPNGISVPAKPA
jgi:hypothetical protein